MKKIYREPEAELIEIDATISTFNDSEEQTGWQGGDGIDLGD